MSDSDENVDLVVENSELVAEEAPSNVTNAPIENLIADIFGDSEDEDDYESRNADSSKPQRSVSPGSDGSRGDLSADEYDGTSSKTVAGDRSQFRSKAGKVQSTSKKRVLDGTDDKFTYDFDQMMQKKRFFNRLARKRNTGDFDLINDNDDEAFKLIDDMANAAKTDRELNEQGKIALKKLSLLAKVKTQVLRSDMSNSLIEQGLYQAFYNWLIPLPDGSLPHLKIRSTILGLFEHLPTPRPNELRKTGLGKVINVLSKHPQESRANKEIARQLVSDWSRIIFGLDRNGPSHESSHPNRKFFDSQAYNKSLYLESMNASQKGNDGNSPSIPRARVPQPSSKDYVNRPVSNMYKSTESDLHSDHPPQPTVTNPTISNLSKKMKQVRKAK